LRADIALAATAGDRQRAPEFLDLGEKRNFSPKKKRFWKRHPVP